MSDAKTPEEIEIQNKNLREKINAINLKKDVLEQKKLSLEKLLVAPCKCCLYDGVYRCETCKENYYENFNVKDYPKP